MKRMKEAWDDICKNSTIGAQTFRENAARFHKDNSLLNLIKVKDGNDAEPESIRIKAIEPVTSKKNVAENENNEKEIMENINEKKDEETRIMRLMFEEILHTLKASTKESNEERERPMKMITKYVLIKCFGKNKECSIETQRTKQLGKVPKMEKFEEYLAGIWKDNNKTPQRKRMNTVAKKIGQKVTNVQEFKKRKKWSTQWIDGVQNFWWKKFTGIWSAISRCFNQWLEQPDEIPDWLTQGRTVLLPKTEDLSNERNYCQITYFSTWYKIFTSMLGNYRKGHAERNNIWDINQLGTCSGVLGTVDQ